MRMAVLDDAERYFREQVDWGRLPAGVTVDVLDAVRGGQEELVRLLGPYEIVVGIRERTPFPRALLERLPSLQLLITTGMYNQSFDMAAAAELGVVVAGAPGDGRGPSELTWGLVIGVLRHLVPEDRALRRGDWGTTVGGGLHGRTLGIVGLGRIGGQVADVGRAFGMDVIAWSRTLTAETAARHGASAVGLDEVLRRADVVSVHVPLRPETRGMIGARELGLMKPTAVLVNTSRGPVVDEAALVDALRERRIAGAGLDVYDTEPLPAGHPLTRLDNTMLVPHRGYVTEENYRAWFTSICAVVDGFLAGSTPNVLDADVLSSPRLRARSLRAP